MWLARIIHERFCCNRGRWKSESIIVEIFLRPTSMYRALDLASAVTTHLDAVSGVQAGGLAARSVNVPPQVCLPPSRHRAPVSHGDCAISPRIVMSNAG